MKLFFNIIFSTTIPFDTQILWFTQFFDDIHKKFCTFLETEKTDPANFFWFLVVCTSVLQSCQDGCGINRPDMRRPTLKYIPQYTLQHIPPSHSDLPLQSEHFYTRLPNLFVQCSFWKQLNPSVIQISNVWIWSNVFTSLLFGQLNTSHKYALVKDLLDVKIQIHTGPSIWCRWSYAHQKNYPHGHWPN